jgi:tRNA A-37 threonylcarbamoyl transferase component Bud32
LNAVIDKGESFSLKKHDHATTVGIIRGKDLGLDHDLLVKRFNYRGFFDFLLHKLFHNRARRLRDINLRLFQKGLPVPEPLSYSKLSFTQKHSFYLSLVIENAEKLSDVYRKGLFLENKNLVQKLARTIAEWHLKGAVHGDLKWPNILVQECGREYKFFLIDLDQSRIYSAPSPTGIIKDLKRFYRFGLEMGAEQWVDTEFFPAYLTYLPDEIKANIDFAVIKNRAIREWIKKGRKRL